MKLTKTKLKQIIKEELQKLYESDEEKYLLKTGAFCMGKQCRADVRLVEIETTKVKWAAKGMGTNKQEALAKALAELQKQVKHIDIRKVKGYPLK